MKGLLLSFLLVFSVHLALVAQPPTIVGVERPVSITGGTVIITGSGFSSTASDLSVWFGAVEAEVISSTASLIEVRVPLGSHADNITVINTATGLSGKSVPKHYSSFSGETFDPSKIGTALRFQENNQLQDLCTCDFNKDRRPDIAATKYDATSASIRILLNNSNPGTLAFNPGSTITLNSPTNDVVCGDLNNDGWPDLVATKGGGSGIDRNAVYIVPNNGGTAGTVSQLLIPAGTATTEQVVIRDLNFDGLPELIVSNSKNNNLYIFRNNSSGAISFASTPITLPITGIDGTTGLEVQDLNRDNRPEIIVAAKTGSTADIKVLVNISTRDKLGFDEPQTYAVAPVIQDVITGDFNRDGLLDIATSSAFGIDEVNILINTSTVGASTDASSISFDAPKKFSAKAAWGLDVGDVDGDGWLDIMVGNTSEPAFNIIHNQSTEGSFNMNVDRVDVAYNTRNVSINDYDRDGKPDFSFTSQINPGYNVEILRNENCFVPIIISETPRKICNGQSFTVYSVPSPGTTYTWYLDNVEIKSGTENFVDVSAAGTLTVTAEQEGGSCLTDSNQIVWEDGSGTIPNDPVITPVPPACVGETFTIDLTEVAGATYEWTGPNGFTSTLQDPQIVDAQPEDAGVYTVVIKLGDCQSSEISTTVEVYSFPTLIPSSSTGNGFCDGTTSTLSVPAVTGLTYEWFEEGNNTALGSGASFDITTGGTYYVVATNTAYGCTLQTENITVQSTPPPVVDLNPDGTDPTTICAGEALSISATVSADAALNPTYLWDFGNGDTSTEQNPVYTYPSAGTFTLTLTVSYADVASCSGTDTESITITDAVPPVISPTPEPICPGEESVLSVVGTYTSYTWKDVSGITIGNDPTVTVNQPGLYTVDTQDASGCPGFDEHDLLSKTVPEVSVFQLGTTEKDTVITEGESIKLIALGTNISSYLWDNEATLDNATIAEPTATPLEATRYMVIASSADMCTDSAFVNVSFPPMTEVNVTGRDAFTPNGDTYNDFFEILGIENYQECTLTVFDRRGTVVYQATSYANDWNGTSGGKQLPTDTYFWMVSCPNTDIQPKKGTLLLVR